MSEKSSTFAAAFVKNESCETLFEHKSFVSLAQLVEQLTLNQWVEGSSPSGDTKRVASNRGPFAIYNPKLDLFCDSGFDDLDGYPTAVSIGFNEIYPCR